MGCVRNISKYKNLLGDMMMSEAFEFEYNSLQEMLIVNHQEGFSYNMSYEDDVFSVATKLNEQQATISRLEEENEQLRQFINKGRRLSVKELMNSINENESLKKKIKRLEKENSD